MPIRIENIIRSRPLIFLLRQLITFYSYPDFPTSLINTGKWQWVTWDKKCLITMSFGLHKDIKYNIGLAIHHCVEGRLQEYNVLPLGFAQKIFPHKFRRRWWTVNSIDESLHILSPTTKPPPRGGRKKEEDVLRGGSHPSQYPTFQRMCDP